MKILALTVLTVISVAVITYPLISNYLSERNRSLIETQYTETVRLMDTEALDEAFTAAEEYNRTLLSVPGRPYTKDALIQAAESYDALLNIQKDGIMGYVDIPIINVSLPMYHGTDDNSLDRGIGHLLGSSLPVGGAGSHCVLTGHSGLAGQKMFSDLNLLKEGDVFFLRVLNQKLAYRVTELFTILPEDTEKLMIEGDRDLCTLVTCTPYGVNSHRLLVRGERTEYEEASNELQYAEFAPTEESTWGKEYRRGLAFGGLAVVGTVACAEAVRRLRMRPSRKAPSRRNRPKSSPMRTERKRGKHEAP